MHEQLHKDDQLSIFLTIEDDEIMRLEIISHDEDAFDLSVDDEVVVVVDGKPAKVEADDAGHATAELGPAEELAERSFEVMLRVHEFFEGWEFGQG